ncbi:hypothetical protein P7C70_g8620, partial [Phenoliferia sp. Uapishka_3]
MAQPSPATRTLLPAPTPSIYSPVPIASPTAAPVNQNQHQQQREQLHFDFDAGSKRRKVKRSIGHADDEKRGVLEGQDWSKMSKRRTDGLPFAVGYPDCNYVGNDIQSCFPEANTTLVEDVWSKFIWNAQLPTFIGAGYLDVYLYHSDSQTVAVTYRGVQNAAGMIAVLPNSDWWRTETSRDWDGVSNITYPYYFVVVTANATLNGAEIHQSTFSAIRESWGLCFCPLEFSAQFFRLVSSAETSLPSSLLTTASAVTTSNANLTDSNGSTRSPSSSGSNSSSSLQAGQSSGHNSLPAWAIALLVIFGLAFLILLLIGTYFLMRYTRRRSLAAAAADHRGSEGSGEPMLNGAAATTTAPAMAATTGRERATDRDMQEVPLQTPPAGISSSDAERMAQAFRNALRGNGGSEHGSIHGSP